MVQKVIEMKRSQGIGTRIAWALVAAVVGLGVAHAIEIKTNPMWLNLNEYKQVYLNGIRSMRDN